jgi:hypothetical protein
MWPYREFRVGADNCTGARAARKRTSRPGDSRNKGGQRGATSASGSRLCEVRCADGACAVPLVLDGARFLKVNAGGALEGTGTNWELGAIIASICRYEEEV